jgi:hypothetical protein
MRTRIVATLLAIALLRCAPNLDSEHRDLTTILDADVRELELRVDRVDDVPPTECTRLVGWLNTGKFRRQRRVQLSLPGHRMKTVANQLASRWATRGFSVTTAEARTEAGSVYVVTARRDKGSELAFLGYPTGNFAYLTSQTDCRSK